MVIMIHLLFTHCKILLEIVLHFNFKQVINCTVAGTDTKLRHSI